MSFRLAALASIAALTLAGCASSGGSGGSNTAGGNPPSSPAGSVTSSAAVTVAASSSSKGMILTENGKTLYSYDPDTTTASNCNGGCASLWPPVIGTPAAGSGVSAGALGTIKRQDGTAQATYNGHPLYTYTQDTAAGDVNGDGVEGTWHVVTVGAATPTSSSAASSGSGGGYTY